MNLISSPKRKLGINSFVLRFEDHKTFEAPILLTYKLK
jgi:hypothetical protein